MQVALVSDIHAHRVALEAVLAEIDRLGVDQVICLGDVVDVGPHPAQTLAILREREIVCVRGNHDPLDEGPSHAFLRDLEEWTRAQLGAEARAWLASRPLEHAVDLDGTRLHCVHGSPRSVREDVLATTPDDELDAWTRHLDFDVLACGHTHVSMARRLAGRWVVNVGSTGQPFAAPYAGEGSPVILPFFEFAIVRGGRRGPSVELRRVPADRAQVERATRESGMPHAEAWLAQWRW
ncbi:MAG: metallophosphoesterase family protein [Sandaracinaceae bacterium]|nr:metallophosphoesterase family protein [Sandaracinaceae bacterium]